METQIHVNFNTNIAIIHNFLVLLIGNILLHTNFLPSPNKFKIPARQFWVSILFVNAVCDDYNGDDDDDDYNDDDDDDDG